MDELDRLGNRRTKLLKELADLTPDLHQAMRAARTGGATQNEIRERAGYKTIQQVRVILGEARATDA